MTTNFEVTDLLSPDEVVTDVRVADKNSLLGELSRRASIKLGLDEHVVFDALTNREKLGSTGVGQGLALPHARIKEIARMHGVFYKLMKPIQFGAIDDEPVDLFFALLVPASQDREGIRALSCIARQLRGQDILKSIRHATTPEAIFELLTASLPNDLTKTASPERRLPG
jgi:PTS system nitrogen regulatory IIA component